MKLDNPKNAAVFWMQQFFGWVHLEKLVASLIDLHFISALLFFKEIQGGVTKRDGSHFPVEI